MKNLPPLLNREGGIPREMNRPFPVMDLFRFNRNKSISGFNGPDECKRPCHKLTRQREHSPPASKVYLTADMSRRDLVPAREKRTFLNRIAEKIRKTHPAPDAPTVSRTDFGPRSGHYW